VECAAGGWNSNLKRITGKPDVFFSGAKIRRESGVGTLVTEIKVNWRALSETKKDLCKTRRQNIYIYIYIYTGCPRGNG
jgi:hypothetical protein